MWGEPETTLLRWVKTLTGGQWPPTRATLHFYPRDRTLKQLHLLREEVDELIEAFEEDDLVHVAHEWADVYWVITQLGMLWGLPRHALMRALAKANYTKINPKTGDFYRDENGRVRKGPNYVYPDIKGALEQTR